MLDRHVTPPTDEEWATLTAAFDAGDLDRIVELLNHSRAVRAKANVERIHALSVESSHDML